MIQPSHPVSCVVDIFVEIHFGNFGNLVVGTEYVELGHTVAVRMNLEQTVGIVVVVAAVVLVEMYWLVDNFDCCHPFCW